MRSQHGKNKSNHALLCTTSFLILSNHETRTPHIFNTPSLKHIHIKFFFQFCSNFNKTNTLLISSLLLHFCWPSPPFSLTWNLRENKIHGWGFPASMFRSHAVASYDGFDIHCDSVLRFSGSNEFIACRKQKKRKWNNLYSFPTHFISQ